MITAVDIVKNHEYSIETWLDFKNDRHLPEGLYERAVKQRADCESRNETVTHVLYDRLANADGFMIMGQDPELLCLEMKAGVLSEDEKWSKVSAPTSVTVATPSI